MLFHFSVILICVLLVTHGNCYTNMNAMKLLKLLNTDNKDISPKILLIVKSDYDNLDTEHKTLYGDKDEVTVSQEHLKPVLRGDSASKSSKLLKYQHKKKMDEIMEFLKDHYSSTNYFYSEMMRINRQYTVKDKMREMIDYLEQPQNFAVKDIILNKFDKLKKKKEEEKSLWEPDTNDLVINIVRDPFNDGVVN